MDWLKGVNPGTVGALIPLAAVVLGMVLGITKAIIRHRERMAMIEKGMDPDAAKKESNSQESG